MKKSVRNLAFSAALVAAAVTFTSCRNNEQTVYGPPPQSNVEADVYGPPPEEYDASSNIEEDVYGPPPEDYNAASNDPVALYGPPSDYKK